jgi:N-sulfoglucosamine sulfohydrolase
MKLIVVLLPLLAAVTLGQDGDRAQADSMPARMNVLVIVSEDNGPQLGCFGDAQARTPRLDELAKGGVLFQTAYTTASVCSPARASILTGLYPHEHGQMGLATHKHRLYRHWPNMVSLFKEAGYRTGMIGKLHVNPAAAFPLDMHAFKGSNFNSRPVARMARRGLDFVDEDAAPFLLVVNLPDAHFPLLTQQDGLPENPRGAEDVRAWAWLAAESERLRGFVADYYNCMERMDSAVGMLLDGLAERGLDGNTLVIYVADHGPQFSRGKTSAYEPGLHVPLIVRTPDCARPGTQRSELVSIVDLLPTVLDCAGLAVPVSLSGRSLRPLLGGDGDVPWREYIVGLGLGGAPVIYFPQYGIRDDRFKLVVSPVRGRRNTNAVAYLEHHNAFFLAGTEAAEIEAGGPDAQALHARYLQPPEVELYDLLEDPDERVDLAADPEYRVTRDRLLGALNSWRERRRDPLAEAAMLAEFTALNDRLVGAAYRKDREFRWPHLDAWDEYVHGQKGKEDR